jgi:hypothetical protein
MFLQGTRATTCPNVTLLQQISLMNNGVHDKIEETPVNYSVDYVSLSVLVRIKHFGPGNWRQLARIFIERRGS